MDPDDIKRRCEEIVSAIDIPVPLSMTTLRAEVSRITGRPIEVRVVDTPAGGPCGLWVSISGKDLVYVTAGTSVDHQRHVELHELGHILAGHNAVPLHRADIGLLVPDLDPALVGRMLARTNFDTGAEREAELLATMIECAATEWALEPKRAAPADDAEILQRIDHDLSWLW
ncbi:hypothetical protein [Actinoplanes sp. L3-i22]|uniref:hypothetical protein n=1 Tax=Actinoplanes sp. L3-i22 TaxID=2836373 RepID=UPI001C79287D|nr:hypothetical protein [Actinoplanes sp. L3-i22]BCY13435.1 hypothetical protein L3i22_085230 [Actinoplanes sp. L3-i22]